MEFLFEKICNKQCYVLIENGRNCLLGPGKHTQRGPSMRILDLSFLQPQSLSGWATNKLKEEIHFCTFDVRF
jgi:hypothetical protein